MKNFLGLLHPQMQDWLEICEAADTEVQLDITAMSMQERQYSRVVYHILVQLLVKGHCATLVYQRRNDMNGFRLWRRLKE